VYVGNVRYTDSPGYISTGIPPGTSEDMMFDK